MTAKEAIDWVITHVQINPSEYADWGKVHRALNELAARELPRVSVYYATKDILPTKEDADCNGFVLVSNYGIAWHEKEQIEYVSKSWKYWAPVPKVAFDATNSQLSSIKTQEQIQAELTHAKVFTSAEFRVLVFDGLINEYDGIGSYHDGRQEIKVDVFQYENGLDVYPFVCWYNK